MNKASSAAPASPRPSKEERHELRRDEIVDAAKTCVVRHGFHAASMAQIAASAQMSVGQIYRYFVSKEAIVQAIVERIVARKLAWMVDAHASPLNVDFLTERIVSRTDVERDDLNLLLEVTAEATRNPEVARILRDADRKLHREAEAAVGRQFPHMDATAVAARVELMAVLSEGTAFRRSAAASVDPRVLADVYRDVIRHIFAWPHEDPTKPPRPSRAAVKRIVKASSK